jgi:hypothetical protein
MVRVSAHVAIVLLLSVTAVQAQADRASIAGVAGVKVVIEVEGDVERPEWAPVILRGDVETALRTRGIPVLPDAEWAKAPGRPLLRLELTVEAGPSGTYIYTVGAELEQDVRLARDASQTLPATTWSSPSHMGFVKSGNPAPIREAVRTVVETFTTAHAEANRKR